MPRSSFTTYTSFTNPVNVSNGTLLSASLYNASLGPWGNLQYLYESLAPNFGDSAYYDANLGTNNFYPAYFEALLNVNQSIANSVWTTIVWDNILYGGAFLNSPQTSFMTNVSNPPMLSITNYPQIPQNILIQVNVRFATNATGGRHVRIVGGVNGGAIDSPATKIKSVGTNNSTTNNQNTTFSEVFEYLYTPTGSGQSFNFGVQVFQNSGAALSLLNGITFVRVVKLPRT